MEMRVREGEETCLGDRKVVVTTLMAQVLPLVRSYLLGVARAGGTVTYGELRRDLELPYAPQSLGRVLNALSVDCERRDEPLLASLVVGGGSLESTDFAPAEAEAARELVYRRWLSQTFEGGGQELLGPVRGLCPRCGAGEVTRIVWGMPAGPADRGETRLPEWVVFGGCLIQHYNASCDQCGQRWTADEQGQPVFMSLEDVHAYAGTATEEELEGWLSDGYELDAQIMETGVEDGVAYAHIGFLPTAHGRILATAVEFPILVKEFWEQLDEQHEETEAEVNGAEA